MLQFFFALTEKQGGSANIRPHRMLDTDAQELKNVLIVSYLDEKNKYDNMPKYISLTVPDNLTTWEFIEFISQKVNRNPIKDYNMTRGQAKEDIRGMDYCKSLNQLFFESQEEIKLTRYSISPPKVPLINAHTGKLVKEAEWIFKSWFNKYSIPASEVPDLDLEKSTASARYMTKHTALEFLSNAM